MLAGSAPRKNLARLRNPRAEYYAWKMEETERILDELRTQSEAGVPIIVEGRRDEAALRRLGVAGGGHRPKAGGGTRHEILRPVEGAKETVAVARFDREGKETETRLDKENSQRRGKSEHKAVER